MVDWRGQVVSDAAEQAAARSWARLLGVEAVATVVELVVVGAPLAGLCLTPGEGRQVLMVAAVLAFTLFVAQTVRLFDCARPIIAVLSARQNRQPVTPEGWQRAQRAHQRLPGESGWLRFFAWVAVAVLLVSMAVARKHVSPAHGVGILVLTLITLAGVCALRTASLAAVLARVRVHVFPNVSALGGVMKGYRRPLGHVALAAAGIGHALFAAVAAIAAGLDCAAMGLLGTLALPVLLVGAVLWWRSCGRWSRDIDAYFDVVRKTTATRGLSRDEPTAIDAFRAAQALPYRLALYHGFTMSLALVFAIAAGRWLLGRDAITAAHLLLSAGVVIVPLTFAVMLSLRRVLLSLLAHLGSRHHLPLDRIRSRVGLGTKLAAYLSCAALVAMGFAHLSAGAAKHSGIIAVLGLLLLAGLVFMMVRDLMSPVAALAGRSDEMARGELARPVHLGGEADEIGRLALAFEEMRRALRDRLRSTESINVDLEREVRRRTEALERRNTELRVALDKLEKAQEDLVRSEKLASMGRLVAGIAHEVNNPINAVINTLGPLKETLTELTALGRDEQAASLCKDAHEMLRVIERGADRTGAIVRALHNYSRSDETSFKDVDLRRCAIDAVDLLRHPLRDIDVDLQIDPDLRVRGLASQLDQVMMNLVANAGQAITAHGTAAGRIKIAARVMGDEVFLTIADNGPGIPPEVRQRIFDPFFTTKGVGEGSGLGLSIVHGIVERHGGRISVSSEPGTGTTFEVVLPRLAKSETSGNSEDSEKVDEVGSGAMM